MVPEDHEDKIEALRDLCRKWIDGKDARKFTAHYIINMGSVELNERFNEGLIDEAETSIGSSAALTKIAQSPHNPPLS